MNAGIKLTEVVSPRIGELRLRDVNALLRELDGFGFVAVALQPDGPPLRARVRIAQRWAGRGWHYMLGCPRCDEPVRVLLARSGELLCEECRGHLTERQRQRSGREWNRDRGDVFDRILRTLGRTVADGSALESAAGWARALARAEEAQVQRAEELATAALSVVQGEFNERLLRAGIAVEGEGRS